MFNYTANSNKPDASPSASKTTKSSKSSKAACLLKDTVKCDPKGKKQYVCLYNEAQVSFTTECVKVKDVQDYLDENEQNYCGECTEEVLTRFIDFLDTEDNASDALEKANPQDVDRIVEAVRSYVHDDELKSLISAESIISVYYPHEIDLFENSDLIQRKLDGLSEEMNLNLVDRQLSYSEDCNAAIWGFVISLIMVILGLTPLAASSQAMKIYPQAIRQVFQKFLTVRLGSETAVLWQIVDKIDDSIKAGQTLKVVYNSIKIANWWISIAGLKVFFKLLKEAIMKTKPTELEIAFLTTGLLLQLFAWSCTGWGAFIAQALVVAVYTAQAIIKKLEMDAACEEKTTTTTTTTCPLIDCDDGNLCTINEVLCDHCGEPIPVTCSSGFSCDPSDGKCKRIDELVPCVAVIDEDDNFSPYQESTWEDFRSKHPSRPFCLLIPNPESAVEIPSNFKSDDLTVWYSNIVRDYGDPTKAEDWATKCGLNLYDSNSIGYVALFVDDSGSMKKSQVIASYEKFVADMRSMSIKVKPVVNSEENWIRPFLTTLVPAKDCGTTDGRVGTCTDVADCAAIGGTSVPGKSGDPEPNCLEFESNIQCCVPQECKVEGGYFGTFSGTCVDTIDCAKKGGTSFPWNTGDPEPNCRSLPKDVQCCI